MMMSALTNKLPGNSELLVNSTIKRDRSLETSLKNSQDARKSGNSIRIGVYC